MIETKWSTDGFNTQFFRPNEAKELYKLKESRPWLSLENIELVGISEKSINVTYDGKPTDQILAIFGIIETHVYCDYYAIEFYHDGRDILKIYDQDLSNHPLPSLPKGARLDPLKSGIGIYNNMAKIYFLHDDPKFVHEWWGSTNIPEQISKLTYFGIEFNRETLEMTDLSQYSIYKDEDLG